MQKTKLNLLIASVIGLVSVFVVSSAFAQESVVVKPETVVEAQNTKGNVNKNQVNVSEKDDAEEADATTKDASKNKGKNKENKGQVTAQSHRSTVANFVQGILAVAGREGGIGQQVRVAAQQQNDSKEKVAESIDKVEKRSKFKTFLIGTDYKNTGALRSEMVKTRNQIEQLKRLAVRAENEGSKDELQSQIQNLEQEQANIESFISQNENKFSLLGWVSRFLSGYPSDPITN